MAPGLPVRDLLDSRLADILDQGGCPVCRYRARSAERFIAAVLGEMVNDRGFRADLDAARGFCPAHTHAIVRATRTDVGGTVAAAILFGAIGAVRGRELDAATEGGRSRIKRIADARRAPACPVCRDAATAEEHAAARLVDRSADPAWAAELAAAELCLDHLLQMAGRGGAIAPWRPIERQQRVRVGELVERLRRFAHHSSHDRRHLVSDEERRSADEAARLLGGMPPDGARPEGAPPEGPPPDG